MPTHPVSIPVWQVNAFTDRPFHGNPAAVCWLTTEMPTDWMQALAAEMNLSETAFVRPLASEFELRWFTPTMEVDLCGHATLATAHALWAERYLDPTRPLVFHTRSGPLSCVRVGSQIELDFPATPPVPLEERAALERVLGQTVVWAGSSRFYQMARLESAAAVRSCQPDFTAMQALPTLGVIITALADESGFDIVSRFFAPAMGVNEDPVCGSAHCCLTPYWSGQLRRTELNAFQASSRGGELGLSLRGDRVALRGQAVTVWRGEVLATSPVD